MKKNYFLFLCTGLALLCITVSCSKIDDLILEATNKQKAVAVLESLETGDSTAALKLMDPNYIQHNLYVQTGRAAFINLSQITKKYGLKLEIKRVLAEDQCVFLHSQYNYGAYSSISFDVFRFDKGKIVEHWDNGQNNVTPTTNGHTLIDGYTTITDLNKSATNKAKIKTLIDTVFIAAKILKISEYVSKNIIQHDPLIADGISGIQAASEVLAEYHYTSIFKLIAEGNFVLAMSKGTYKGKDAGLYDLFRLDNGIVVEHWETVEEIPDQADWQNTNGKF